MMEQVFEGKGCRGVLICKVAPGTNVFDQAFITKQRRDGIVEAISKCMAQYMKQINHAPNGPTTVFMYGEELHLLRDALRDLYDEEDKQGVPDDNKTISIQPPMYGDKFKWGNTTFKSGCDIKRGHVFMVTWDNPSEDDDGEDDE